MPPRISGQDDRAINRYKSRLNEEMKLNGETDRSLADKLTARGVRVPFSSINKTRNGSRQPTLDECYAVAMVFGYPDLDSFMDGPAANRLFREWARFMSDYVAMSQDLREVAQGHLHNLYVLLNDPEVVASLDERMPGWRTEWAAGRRFDFNFVQTDLEGIWRTTFDLLGDVLANIEGSTDAKA